MKNDSLGDRMKEQYEFRARTYLPRRTYTVIRVDQKAAHTYTRGLSRPYDKGYMDDIDGMARYLCENIQGAKLAYTQSDECSLILTDFDTIQTDAWFNGNIQKITSISASMSAAKFNQLRLKRQIGMIEKELTKEEREEHQGWLDHGYTPIPERHYVTENDINKLAVFDSRCFVITDMEEIINYLIFRQQDCIRNSIQMTAQANFSHKELQGRSCDELQEMLFQEKEINWSKLPEGFKNGRLVKKETHMVPSGCSKDGRSDYHCPEVERTRWVADGAPVFTQNRDLIKDLLPKL